MTTPRQVCVVNVGLDGGRLDSRRVIIDPEERVVHRKLGQVVHELRYFSEVHLTSVFIGSGKFVK